MLIECCHVDRDPLCSVEVRVRDWAALVPLPTLRGEHRLRSMADAAQYPFDVIACPANDAAPSRPLGCPVEVAWLRTRSSCMHDRTSSY